MQKFSIRNRCKPNNNKVFEITATHKRRTEKLDYNSGDIRPQRLQRICQRETPAAVTASASRQLSVTRPTIERVCSRNFSKESDNIATWDEVLSVGCGTSKSLPSAVSSSLVDSNTASRTQEPVQPTSAVILEEVPSKVPAADNNNANENRNKDDDDNNCCSRQHQQRITEAVMPDAISSKEFMTFERLRLGDQINFLLFDPYRTLKFLITELKSRLRTVVPDDINVQKILVEIQQTIKRIRNPNASEPMLPLPPTTRITRTTSTEISAAEMMAAAVECISTKDALINHASKVNSSCQTIASPRLGSFNACQICDHQMKQGAAGCNQKQMNRRCTADDWVMKMDVTRTCNQQKDLKKNMDLKNCSSFESLQGIIKNLKIKSNPFSRDTQEIITQLETELVNFQNELENIFSLSLARQPLWEEGSVAKTSEELGKRLLEKKEEKLEQERETFLDFITKLPTTKKKLDSTIQAVPVTMSKESQTNLKSPAKIFNQLEKEKLLLLQKFRASEMQTIQGDLNELHVFIKDQLNAIYQTITRDNQNFKYHSNDREPGKNKKNHQSNSKRPEKTHSKGPPLSSTSSPSFTTPTSSVSSSSKMQVEGGTTPSGSSISPRHYKKSSSPKHIPFADNGNANNTKSMMKQKLSSSSLSASDAKESYSISDVDKADKGLDEKNSRNPHRAHTHDLQEFYGHKHLFTNVNCCGRVSMDTPFYSEEKNHFSAVDSEGFYPHAGTTMDDTVQRIMTSNAARTSTKGDINSAKKTSRVVMTHHQHDQQYNQQSRMTASAQDQGELISSSLPVPPCITMHSKADETSLNPDAAVTNAAVKNIIYNAYAATATAVGHSNGIRAQRRHHKTSLAHNSWQCVNLKNPTSCQLKKQIYGDRYEYRINNNDNHSNFTEIHDCQKCRANNVISSAEMHRTGDNNSGVFDALASTSNCNRNSAGRKDFHDAGDGLSTHWNVEENESAGAALKTVSKDLECQISKKKKTGKLHCRDAKSAFQMNLKECAELLDKIPP